MHKENTLNKTNFAIELGRNLSLISLKFVDLIQWFLQDNYGKEYYDIPISFFNKIVGNGKNTCSRAQIKKLIGHLLVTKVDLFSAKYVGAEACTYISYFQIFEGFIRIKVDDDLQNRYNINYAIENAKGDKIDGYNTIYLSIIKRITNKYAYRLYPYFIAKKNQSKGRNSFDIDVSEIRKFLNCERVYKNFNEFNRSVLQPAIKILNEKTDLNILIRKDEKTPLSLNFIVTKQALVVENKPTEKPIIVPSKIEPKAVIQVPKTQEIKEEQEEYLPPELKEMIEVWHFNKPQMLKDMYYSPDEAKKRQLITIYLKIKGSILVGECRSPSGLLRNMIDNNYHYCTTEDLTPKPKITDEQEQEMLAKVERQRIMAEQEKVESEAPRRAILDKARQKHDKQQSENGMAADVFNEFIRQCIAANGKFEYQRPTWIDPCSFYFENNKLEIMFPNNQKLCHFKQRYLSCLDKAFRKLGLSGINIDLLLPTLKKLVNALSPPPSKGQEFRSSSQQDGGSFTSLFNVLGNLQLGI